MTAGPQDIRFEVDHMLVKLGKYLRILGYDATWDPRLRTHEMILRANREDRVFLTRNTRLPHGHPPPKRVLVLASGDAAEQLQRVVAEFSLDTEAALFSKCIRCNELLDEVADKESVRERVHPNVYDRYDRFLTCPKCGTVFWLGSHVRNTCRKLGLPPP